MYSRNIRVLLWLLLCRLVLNQANAQISTFPVRFSTETAALGDTVAIKVRAGEFRELLEYQWTVAWNPADLKFIKYTSAGATLPGQLFGAGASSQGYFRALWSDPNGYEVSLPDNTLLFTLYLKVLNPAPGYYPVMIDPKNEPTTFEAVDKFERKKALACIAGGVRVSAVSDLAFDSLAPIFYTCNNYLGRIETWVSGGAPPYQYQWFKAGNPISQDTVLSGVANDYYTLKVSDAAGAELEAVAGISTFNYAFSVSVNNSKPAHCKSSDGCAVVSLNGGLGPYQYNWSSPGASTSERCDLPAGPVQVTVTDAHGCFAGAGVNITRDTVLGLNADSLNADCRFKQKGGARVICSGTPPYEYHWSTGGSTQQIEHLAPGIYSVTVTDGAGCSASSSVKVLDYGTFDWSLGVYVDYEFGAALEDHVLPKSTVGLESYDFSSRAKFPLYISWNTGTRQYVETLADDEFYKHPALLEHVPNGYYSVSITDADGCSETRSIKVKRKIPVIVAEAQPAFFVNDRENTLATLDSCVEVYAQYAQDVTAVDLAIGWPTAELAFKAIQPVFPGINLNHFSVHDDFIDFHWIIDSLAVFPEDSTLFKVCFEPKVNNSYFRVGFKRGSVTPGILRKTSGNMGFIGKGGGVHFAPVTDNPNFAFPTLLPPSCENDGYARIALNSSYGLAYNDDGYSPAVNYNGKYYYGPERIRFALPGDYYITQGGAVSNSVYAYIPPYDLPASECVWPGDASNDNIVNQFDLLYLALGMGRHFEPRAEQDTLWKGCDAAEWPESTPNRHINFKHLDLDGNGWVEPLDMAVLNRHWEQVVSPYGGYSPYLQPYAADSLAAAWAIALQADTLDAGKMLDIPVYAAAEGIEGLAFSISYDSVLVVSAVDFQPAASWFGDPQQNLVFVQKDFQGQSRFDLALARTDGQASSGSGLIGHLRLRFVALPPDSLLKTMLFTAHALAITPEEKLIGLPESSKAVYLKGGFVSGVKETTSLSATLYPNPASEALHISCGDQAIRRVEIIDAAGVKIQEINTKTTDAQIVINTATLPSGVYYARVYTEGAVAISGFVKK